MDGGSGEDAIAQRSEANNGNAAAGGKLVDYGTSIRQYELRR
jgi:hypothetical protein